MGRVILLGGGGFIGSALKSGLTSGELAAPSRNEVDLCDRDRLSALLRPGDIVVNAAGYALATDRTPRGLARFRRDNVDAVRTLADVAAEVGVAHLVHLSSVAAMGQRGGVDLSEDDLATPRTSYGQSKRDAEVLLVERMDRLPITILRPTSIFGEGRGLASTLCRVASLPVIPLPAGGASLIPFSYVGNLASAVETTLGRSSSFGRTFIVGDEHSYVLRDVVLALANALGRGRRPAVSVPTAVVRAIGSVEGRLARARRRTPLLDPTRIETLTTSISYSTAAFHQATGFVAPVSLETAVERIAAWYQGRTPA
jgi:nucleoside-diphosphate-sugar epimerase